MTTDASFETVASVKPHPKADRLDIATICGWTVVVGKGEFKPGDTVFYIREDARLEEALTKDHATGWKWPWQEPLLKYVSGSGRVKTIKLRGIYSSGIAIPVSKVLEHINRQDSVSPAADNDKIKSEDGAAFLKSKYGVSHWEMPVLGGLGPCNAIGALPAGITKSDEQNCQELDAEELHIGETALVTKKLDGTSTTVVAYPDGTTHVCSRSQDLDQTKENVWNIAARPIVPLALAWAKYYGKPIAIRGETCGRTVQNMSFNHDREVDTPTFFTYGIVMPEEPEYAEHNGLYGTKYHFTEIAKQIKELTGQDLKTVPVLGEEVVSEDMLNKWKSMPLDWGEGVVINTRYNHYKCKSLAYLEALSKA